MSALQQHYYNKQLRRYITQFMAVFGGMEVQVGWNENKEPRLISIPIASASKDRVVAWIKGEQTQNKQIRLPMFSVQLVGLRLAPEMRKGVGLTRRNTVFPVGGLFPDDIQVVQQRMPVPYVAQFQLGIWSSNQDQHYQIVEQILSLFDPKLQIQTSDDVMDWTRLTELELTGINFEENVPAGTDRRLIQTTLDFDVPIYLSLPADVHNRFVQEIFLRVGAVGADATSSFDIIEELDEQGVEYEHVFSADSVDIGEEN